MDASAHFRGKRITVMGLGLLGRGVGDAKYLAECGAEVIVTDLKTREQLTESVTQLESFPNISFVLGEHRLEDFRGRDLILKAPKTPLDSLYLKEAKKNDIHVTMSTALFAKYAKEADATIIGVTGTRGKSTTTEMIAHVLRNAGRKILLGGNIRGISTLALLPEVTSETIAVLELDSWQLQGFEAEKISPDIAVFTNLMPDHLDYYGGDMARYFADKANIYKFQKKGDTLIVGFSVLERMRTILPIVAPVIPEPELGGLLKLRVIGKHNEENASFAATALIPIGLTDEEIKKGLESFSGVPGRLELIAEKNGIKIYNDTTATTPEATLAALAALDPASTVLIMGGADKGLDMNVLISKLPEVKKIILLAGTGTDRIKNQLPGTVIYESIGRAVTEAFKVAKSGDIILFSPAFASFGMFKNEFDRGDQFNELVKALPQ